jgi:hypothetical protein
MHVHYRLWGQLKLGSCQIHFIYKVCFFTHRMSIKIDLIFYEENMSHHIILRQSERREFNSILKNKNWKIKQTSVTTCRGSDYPSASHILWDRVCVVSDLRELGALQNIHVDMRKWSA